MNDPETMEYNAGYDRNLKAMIEKLALYLKLMKRYQNGMISGG